MIPRKIGLIGYPLKHSFSKSYFSQKIKDLGINDLLFENVELRDISNVFEYLTEQPEFIGLAVTIPHKISILRYLDEIDDFAQSIGSVNCLQIRNGKIKGYNTDAIGFEQSIRPLLKEHHKKALVLGSGGSSKTVIKVLNQLGIETKVVSRNPIEDMIGYEALTAEMMSQHLIVVNCSPVGMFPDVEASPEIPYEFITDQHLFYDLIYNPSQTVFLQKAKQFGAETCNGLNMLHIQAEENWRIWNQR
jgi:shikimate dehydrogenase